MPLMKRISSEWRKVCSNPMNNYISCKRPRMHFAPVAVALFRRCMLVRNKTEFLRYPAGDAFVSMGSQSRWSTGKKPPLWSVGDSKSQAVQCCRIRLYGQGRSQSSGSRSYGTSSWCEQANSAGRYLLQKIKFKYSPSEFIFLQGHIVK